MNQEKLESRVEEIFRQQGFQVEKDGNRITAVNDGVRKKLQVFSSEEYSIEDVASKAEEGRIIFVDEGLDSVRDRVENEVSAVGKGDDREKHNLPSYELIGDIAVINELTVEKDEAVEGILDHHPHVKTILLKQEPLSGEYRIGEYTKLHGDETETTHREFGCRYRVDPTRAYFSERLATERKRVADQVGDGERMLVIGAGVGPYPILIARKRSPEKVVAVEKNPDAFQYLEENIELNDVSGAVEAVEGDALEVTPGEEFDRVIIAIPESADQFLELAFSKLADGGAVHYYRFLEDENWEELEREVEEAAEKTGADIKIQRRVECGQRGPSVERVCLDVQTD